MLRLDCAQVKIKFTAVQSAKLGGCATHALVHSCWPECSR